MSYQEKYYIEIDHPGYGSGKISIQEDDYSGGSQELDIVEDQITFSYRFNGWEERVIGTTLELEIVNNFSDFYELEELIFASAYQFKVVFTLDHPTWGNITLFNGFVEPNTIEQEYITKGSVNIQCSTYLNRLQHKEPEVLFAEDSTITYLSILDILHGILAQTGNDFDIRINSYLEDDKTAEDSAVHHPWEHSSLDPDIFKKNSEEFEDSLTVLNHILTSYDMYIYYWNDKWYIENYNSLNGDPDDPTQKEYIEYPCDDSEGAASTLTESNTELKLSENKFSKIVIKYQKGVKKYVVRLESKQWDNLILEKYSNMPYEDFDSLGHEILLPFRYWKYNDDNFTIEERKKGELPAGMRKGFFIRNESDDEENEMYVGCSFRITVHPKEADTNTSMNINFKSFALKRYSEWEAQTKEIDVRYKLYFDQVSKSIGRGIEYGGGPPKVLEVDEQHDLSEELDIGNTSDLSSDGLSGQKDVEVYDASDFAPGDNVKIIELSGEEVSEENVIDSINGDTITMKNDLENLYETDDDAQVQLIDPREIDFSFYVRPIVQKIDDGPRQGLVEWYIPLTAFGDFQLTVNQEVENNYLEAVIDNKAVDKKETNMLIFSSYSYLYMNVPYDYSDDQHKKIAYYTYAKSTITGKRKLQRWLLDGRVQAYHKTRRNFAATMIDRERLIKPFTRVNDDFLDSNNPHSNDYYLITGYSQKFVSGERKLKIYEWDSFLNY